MTRALEWYADTDHYSNYESVDMYRRHSEVQLDVGERARAALAAIGKQEGV